MLFWLKGHEFKPDFKCLGGWSWGSHHTELKASVPSHLQPLPPVSIRNLGGGALPQGHLLPAPTNQSQKSLILGKSHLLSPPKKRTLVISCALHQCNYIICLHVCEFRVYVKCPCHFKLWGFAQIWLCFLMKQIYLFAFRGFPQLIVWF